MTKLSEIADGSSFVNTTDQLVAVRDGDTDVLVTLGSSAVQDVGYFAQTANNLSDMDDANDALNNILPTQTGNAGKALVTDGTNTSWVTVGGGAGAFSSLSGGTNTTAAMVVGTGASLGVSGSGTIAATSAPAAGLTGTALAVAIVTSSLTAVGTLVTGVWNATKIGLAYGGTNADLSATGGTSQVLKQSSTGAAITVGTLAASDLSDGTTGSGNVVLKTSPTLVTPILGVAAATSINKVALTAPATGCTITVADGKTLTCSNSLTLTGTDSTSFAFPATSSTVVTTGNAATFTKGFSATPNNAGTKSSGTFTPDPADGNFQYAVNGGAHTLAPPSNDCCIIVQYTNNGSAGAITTSGFTKVSGSFTTTNGDDFFAYITKNNGYSFLNIQVLQ